MTGYGNVGLSSFNTFYEQCRVAGVKPKELETLRGYLLKNFAIVLKSSLQLLGIETVSEM